MTGRTGILPGPLATGPGMTARPDAGLTRRPVLRMSALDLPALDTAVPKARRHSRHITREWGYPALAGDCELIVAELVTNAVEAVAGPGSAAGSPPIRLRLTRREHGVRIDVWDGSDEMPHTDRNRPPDQPGGWGLVLVDALSARWGSHRAPGSGKYVWAIIGS